MNRTEYPVAARVTEGVDRDRFPGALNLLGLPREYTVELLHEGRSLSSPLFMGESAGEPTAAAVLDQLLYSAAEVARFGPGAEGREAWAGDNGLAYDWDEGAISRQWGRKVAKVEGLAEFLGDRYPVDDVEMLTLDEYRMEMIASLAGPDIAADTIEDEPFGPQTTGTGGLGL